MKYSEIQNIINNADFSLFRKLNISILRNVMIESMVPYIKFMAYEMDYEAKIQIGEYDNIVQEAMGHKEGLLKNDTDCVLIFMKLEGLSWKLARRFAALSPQKIQKEVQSIKEMIPIVLTGIRKQTNGMILWHNFEFPLYPALGISDGQHPHGQTGIIQELNNALRDALADFPNAYYVDLNLCISRVGGKNFYDLRYWHIGRAPYSLLGLTEIAFEDFKFIRPLKGKNKKCLVLDCDNVLWGGVIGEDGLSGIKLDKTHPGLSYYELQEEIVNLYHRGILIALCSKNNSEDVWEVFRKHPDMVLKEEHIVATQINWDDKATNIKKIAAQLNIGLNSMVFVDDSDFEVNLIRQELPEVTVIHLPKDKTVEYKEILASCGFFDTLTISHEDRQRGLMYKAEAQRKELQVQTPDLESYLKSLEMEVEIKFTDDFTISRIAQLTQKTNQFNLTNRRYSDADIKAFAESKDADVLYLRLLDKFGDSGIVGVCILKYKDHRSYLDTFLLSCRVLGRGVEDTLINQALKLAKKRGCREVIGEYLPTSKNIQAKDFLPKHGFSEGGLIFDLNQPLKAGPAFFKKIDPSVNM